MPRPADPAGAAVAPSEQAHLFYDRVIDAAELREALAVDGLDQDIALLRGTLRKHMKAHPGDLDVMLKSVTLLVRAVAARYRMSEKRAADFGAALATTVDLLTDQFT